MEIKRAKDTQKIDFYKLSITDEIMEKYIESYNRFIYKILYKNYDNEFRDYRINISIFKTLNYQYKRLFIYATFTPLEEFYRFHNSYNSKKFNVSFIDFYKGGGGLEGELKHFIYTLDNALPGNFAIKNIPKTFGRGSLDRIAESYEATEQNLKLFEKLSEIDKEELGALVMLKNIEYFSKGRTYSATGVSNMLIDYLNNLSLAIKCAPDGAWDNYFNYILKINEKRSSFKSILDLQEYNNYGEAIKKYNREYASQFGASNTKIIPLIVELIVFENLNVMSDEEFNNVLARYYSYNINYNRNFIDSGEFVKLLNTLQVGAEDAQLYIKVINNATFYYIFNNIDNFSEMPLDWYMELNCDITLPNIYQSNLNIKFPEYSINYSHLK